MDQLRRLETQAAQLQSQIPQCENEERRWRKSPRDMGFATAFDFMQAVVDGFAPAREKMLAAATAADREQVSAQCDFLQRNAVEVFAEFLNSLAEDPSAMTESLLERVACAFGCMALVWDSGVMAFFRAALCPRLKPVDQSCFGESLWEGLWNSAAVDHPLHQLHDSAAWATKRQDQATHSVRGVSLDDIRHCPENTLDALTGSVSETIYSRKYNARDLEELQRTAGRDPELYEYIVHLMESDGTKEAVWRELGWGRKKGRRVDRRYRRLRQRMRSVAGHWESRKEPRPGFGDASRTVESLPLYGGTRGRETAEWEHRMT